MFGKKPTIAGKLNVSCSIYVYFTLFFRTIEEQAKAHSRELKRTDRELGRDRHQLEAEEKRLVRKFSC